MTGCAVLTHRAGSPDFRRHVSPYVRRLHPVIPVGAVGNGHAPESGHHGELAKNAAWILDEPPPRINFFDEVKRPLYEFYTQSGSVSLRNIGAESSTPVMTEGGHAESGTRRGSPEDFRPRLNRNEPAHVPAPVRLEARIKLHGEGSVSTLGGDFTEAPCPGEKLDGTHRFYL